MRVFIDQPDREQRVDVLYAWIGIHADGGEGILSTDLPTPGLPGGATRHMPLITSKRETAELCGRLARNIQRASMHEADRFVRIELREFRLVGNG
jgi:hypothetical protein